MHLHAKAIADDMNQKLDNGQITPRGAAKRLMQSMLESVGLRHIPTGHYIVTDPWKVLLLAFLLDELLLRLLCVLQPGFYQKQYMHHMGAVADPGERMADVEIVAPAGSAGDGLRTPPLQRVLNLAAQPSDEAI